MAVMLAASLSKTVRIDGSACEPHVVDLINFLRSAGVKVSGVGTNSLSIKGKKKLEGADHKVVPDHIEVGTFAIASAKFLQSLIVVPCGSPVLLFLNIIL